MKRLISHHATRFVIRLSHSLSQNIMRTFTEIDRMYDAIEDAFTFICTEVLVGCQHRKANLCQLRGGKPAQSAKDGQRDTMHINYLIRYTITM